MNCGEVIGEPVVRWVLPQGSFEPVGRSAPIRRDTPDRHSVTGDYNGLAVLDRV
jgi:hypothetical protein